MKRSVGLGIILGLCLGIGSRANRGDAAPVVPNCGGCECAVSKAWRFVGSGGSSGYRVLTTRPADNPDGYGDPVSTAHWQSAPSSTDVYSAFCQPDYHDVADNVTYNDWAISNASWGDNCQRLQGQGQGWVVVAVGTGGNQDPKGATSRYACDP